ncbi:LOW QUALITY PROTEIN: hypothetical protein M8C21_012354, partial [Ambrosia artemisiifolia]
VQVFKATTPPSYIYPPSFSFYESFASVSVLRRRPPPPSPTPGCLLLTGYAGRRLLGDAALNPYSMLTILTVVGIRYGFRGDTSEVVGGDGTVVVFMLMNGRNQRKLALDTLINGIVRMPCAFHNDGIHFVAMITMYVYANYVLPGSKDMPGSDEYFDQVVYIQLDITESNKCLDEMKAKLQSGITISPYSSSSPVRY